MASASSVLVEELSCSVCCDIFKDPVILSCSHSFCRGCLQSWWAQSSTRQCPLCKRRSSKAEPPINLILKNLSDNFRQEGDQRDPAVADDLCAPHGEKLKLFCLDHQEPVCIICRDSEEHTGHRFRPINEAIKEILQELLGPQKKTLEVFAETKRKCDQIAAHIKVQTEHTERQIKKEFEKLQRFLQAEEKARITALRLEAQLKGQRMKETIEGLSRQMKTLSDTVKETEEQLKAGKYKAKSAQPTQQPLAPGIPMGALIDVAKHLGNLAFAVWEKLKEIVSYSPVILDPNTAGTDLILSEDLTSMRRGARQQLPENLERLTSGVLGSGFSESGTCCWDVEVGDSTHWELGVIRSNYKKSNNLQEVKQPKHNPMSNWVNFPPALDVGYCKLGFFKGQYRASTTYGQWFDLPAMRKIQRIRMKLDWNTNEVFFINPETYTIIHVCVFNLKWSPIYSLLCSNDNVPLKISPVKGCVTLGHLN